MAIRWLVVDGSVDVIVFDDEGNVKERELNI